MGEEEGRLNSSTDMKKIRLVGVFVGAVLVAASAWYIFNVIRYMVPTFTIAMILGLVGLVLVLVALVRTRTSSTLKTLLLLSVAFLSLSFFVNIFSIPFSSTAKDNYPKQMAYLIRERYVSRFFPDSIPENATGYRLDFCSEDFRSSSYVMLEFSCDEKEMAPFAEQAKKRSVLSAMSIEEARAADLDLKYKAEISGFIGTDIDVEEKLQLQISFPDDIDEHLKAKVYIMRCSDDLSDLKTEAIILDEENNWVCFSTII